MKDAVIVGIGQRLGEVYADDRGALGSGRLALWSVSFTEYLKHPFGEILLGLGLGKHSQLTAPLVVQWTVSCHNAA